MVALAGVTARCAARSSGDSHDGGAKPTVVIRTCDARAGADW